VALKLSLKPGEQFVINGAVITNGDRRSVLIVQNKASILRDRDVMTEAEATTPAKRVYFICMLSYLDADEADGYYNKFVESIDAFMAAIENPRVRLICAQVSFAMMNREYYRALTGCRELIEYETQILGEPDVAERVQKRA
jgi:flagellar protein FlbT